MTKSFYTNYIWRLSKKMGVGMLALLAPLASAQETRPPGNTGVGFFTKNGKIFDKTGAEFVIRGVNHTLWWGNELHNHESITSPNGLVKTGANLIRAVFGPGMGADTPSEMRLEVQSIINQKMVAMVERHDATGNDTATNDIPLQQIVDNVWLAPANLQMLKDFEDRIILNIANEWGPNTTVWRDAYKSAVAKLRKAGVNCLIVIDAGGNFGQNYHSVINYGADIVNSDPQHNIVFSIHMYGFWVSQNRNAALAGTWGPPDNPPYLFEARMNDLRNTGVPILIGEFSTDTAPEVSYKTQDVLNYCQANRVGWIAWSWNQNSGDGPLPMDMLGFSGGESKWLYNSDADLTPCGVLMVKGQNGLLQTSVKANIFGGSVQPPPPPPPPDVIPPSTPTGLRALNVSSTSLILSWTASTDNVGVVGYDVLSNNVVISSSVPFTNFQVNGLTAATNYRFSIRARDAAGNLSPPTPMLSVTTAPSATSILPAPWASQDIGSVGVPGLALGSPASFSITGSGVDIWGTADGFRYVYRPLSGAGEITVHLGTLDNTDPWAKGGVMVRQSLAAGAPYVDFCATPSNGIVLQRRAAANGVSDMPSRSAGSMVSWLRLRRNGNTFSAFQSADGQTWTAAGTTTCVMTDPMFIGLAVTSHNNATAALGNFDNVVVIGQVTPSPIVTPPPPPVTPPAGGTTGTQIISFESLAAGALANPYNDPSGYTLAGAYSPTNASDPLRINLVNANKVLINSNWSSKITLTKTGGGVFSLISFRFASDPWGGLADGTVTGTTATGGTVVSTFTGRTVALQALSLNWSNLTTVVIDFSSGATEAYGLIDDVTVSSP